MLLTKNSHGNLLVVEIRDSSTRILHCDLEAIEEIINHLKRNKNSYQKKVIGKG